MSQSRFEFEKRARLMSTEAGDDLYANMMKAYDHMTDDERERNDDEEKPWYLVRAIGMAVGERSIAQRFNVEAIKLLTPRIKKILNKNR